MADQKITELTELTTPKTEYLLPIVEDPSGTAVTKKITLDNLGIIGGWIPASETWTYASATTITVPSGAASKYQKCDKIKLTQTTVKYFYIVGVTDTVLTITGGSDYTLVDTAITSPYYSKISNPQGFPHWFNITAPTFDTTTYDNGSGGQPTTTECRIRIAEGQYCIHYRGNGTKVGTNKQIAISSHSFVVPANTSAHTAIGPSLVYISDFIVGAISNNYTSFYADNITDNDVIAHFGFTTAYEI